MDESVVTANDQKFTSDDRKCTFTVGLEHDTFMMEVIRELFWQYPLFNKGALLYLPIGRYGCAFSFAKRVCGIDPGQALRSCVIFSSCHGHSPSPVCTDWSIFGGYR